MNSDTVFVKNKSGTSACMPPLSYSSWLDFWEAEKGFELPKCGSNDCDNDDDLQGAHVFVVGSTSKEYIIPLCSTCNSPHNKEEIKVFKQFLVEANQQ